MKSFRPFLAEFSVKEKDSEEDKNIELVYWSNSPLNSKKNCSDAGIELIKKYYDGDNKKRPECCRMIFSKRLTYAEYKERKNSLPVGNGTAFVDYVFDEFAKVNKNE